MVQKFSLRSSISHFLSAFFIATAAITPLQASDLSLDDVLDISLEELLSIEVTSVSKKKQRASDVAAAIYVITDDDIRRSGVNSIPEALRLAPGVQVARIDSSKWSVSVRGFSGRFSNKLLVLIDGRSVYTPVYSGVYWDVNDTLLEDIERIEVIRGPGGTVWGANAMNGVINIITKQSQQTEGGLLVAGVGSQDASVSLRYGNQVNEHTAGRAFIKLDDHDQFILYEDESDAHDDWQSARAGFRLDGRLDSGDGWNLQGDIYQTELNQLIDTQWVPTSTTPLSLVESEGETRGYNLLGQWHRDHGEGSRSSLRFYVDQYERDELYFNQIVETLDVDYQFERAVGNRHNLVWGVGYRQINDEFDNTFSLSIDPDSNRSELLSGFLQDEIALRDDLTLTLGAKLENNEYTGTEVQPSIKGVWKTSEKQTIWASISKAVRTPSRIETGGRVVTGVVATAAPPFLPDPILIELMGNEDMKSERQRSVEMGYRHLINSTMSLDVTAFNNTYRDLQSYVVNPPPSTLIDFTNDLKGETSGLETVIDWRPSEWWQLQASYSYLHASFSHQGPDLINLVDVNENNAPEHQLSIRSFMQLEHQVDLDLWLYYMDELPIPSVNGYEDNISVDSYTSLNVRLAWQPDRHTEWTLAAQHALDDSHLEFVGESIAPPTLIESAVYAKLKLEF